MSEILSYLTYSSCAQVEGAEEPWRNACATLGRHTVGGAGLVGRPTPTLLSTRTEVQRLLPLET